MSAGPAIYEGNIVQRKEGDATKMTVEKIDRQLFGKPPDINLVVYVWCCWFVKDRFGQDSLRRLRFYYNDLRRAQ